MNKSDNSLFKSKIAQRVQRIEPFHVMDLLEKAKLLEAQGHQVIHMEVGEPDFATPSQIVQAGQQALQQGLTKYTPARGILPLRQRLADYYAQRYGVQISPERIIITPGASGALQLALAMFINPGEQVMLSDPGYPCNKNFVELFNGVPQLVPVSPETHFQLSDQLLLQHWTDNTKVALVASPSNPTGTILTPNALKALYEACQQKQGVLIVDEIYQGLTYQGVDSTALAVADDLIVINSFSKYFGMTGWRLGWIVVPEALISIADKLAQNMFLSAPTVAQYAALAAFENTTMLELERRRQVFESRRQLLLDGLCTLGFTIPVAGEGAFYLYANCSRFTDDSFQFAHQLLQQAHVAVTPGIDFAMENAAQYVRFAYTTDERNIQAALSRIKSFIDAI